MTPDADTAGPISVSVTPTFAEYFRLNWWITFRRMRVLTVIAVILVLVYLTLPAVTPARGETVAAKYFNALPLLILPGIVFVLTPAGMYLSARRQWRAAAAIREPRRYTFTEAGVTAAGAIFEGFTAWSNIVSAERVGGLVLLGTSQQQFYLIPVRSFGGGEELARFTQLAAARVSGCRL